MVNVAIKRVESDASINYPERERLRASLKGGYNAGLPIGPQKRWAPRATNTSVARLKRQKGPMPKHQPFYLTLNI